MRTTNEVTFTSTPAMNRRMKRERLVPNSDFMPMDVFRAELRKRVASGEVTAVDAAAYIGLEEQ